MKALYTSSPLLTEPFCGFCLVQCRGLASFDNKKLKSSSSSSCHANRTVFFLSLSLSLFQFLSFFLSLTLSLCLSVSFSPVSPQSWFGPHLCICLLEYTKRTSLCWVCLARLMRWESSGRPATVLFGGCSFQD